MNERPPIACSLPAATLGARLDRVRALGARSLLRADRTADAHVLRFRPDGETRRELEQIVAAERRCCPFLQLGLQDGGELVLTIAAPEEGREAAAALAAAFAGI